jgi:hypothetical protein
MIVGIGVNYQVGKDTAAQALCRDLEYRRLAFADPLRELAQIADPLITPVTGSVNVNIGHGRLLWTVKGCGWEEAKRMFPEVRRFLQDLGVGARRVIGEDVWVNALMGKIASDTDRVVVPDVRFRNEAEAIKARGGFLIRIDRPGHAGDSHESERDLDGWEEWDLVVSNSGSLVELEAQVVDVVRQRLNRARS